MEDRGKDYANPLPTPNPTRKALVTPTKPHSRNAYVAPTHNQTPTNNTATTSIITTTTIVVVVGVGV